MRGVRGIFHSIVLKYLFAGKLYFSVDKQGLNVYKPAVFYAPNRDHLTTYLSPQKTAAILALLGIKAVLHKK
ncbi:hypothetical protein GCM10011571_05610 [Marinithermofilum abyssi]|uniref:Uncharacterized protein n=1 Tax=Marinithermofilum abyssi TaxID=1571185 RepID=A0A8J2Y8P9_9BACL|nr:hypothetical protein GCM10011571_05610 [Marinithermofilum abyssi]